jgi:regulator of sigma E protease
MSLLIFILILSFLVLIHEFGHFIVAKKNGVRVDEFGVGFPPKLFGKKIGETEYTVNALPLGGFVRLYGEEYQQTDGMTEDKKRAFVYKSPLQKSAVILAGIIMNILFGVFLLYVILMRNNFVSDPLPMLFPHTFAFGKQEGRVIAVNPIKGSEAEKKGIISEDIIVSYSKNQSTSKTIFSAEELIKLIRSSENVPLALEIKNLKTGASHFVTVVPKYNKGLKRAVIGVNLIDGTIISYNSPLERVFSGFMHAYNVMDYNFTTVGKLVGISVKEKNAQAVSGAVSGPIGIYGVVNDIVASSGEKLLMNILNLMALLSLSLGVMNVLPFPALDGGRMVFIIYEWIAKKPVNKKIEGYTNLIGFALLIGLAILVSINDVLRLIK